jgi:hypothetical protein
METAMRWHALTLATPLAALALMTASPGSAHHSYSMFDRGRTETLEGVVRSFDMVNPHSWLELATPGRGGAAVEWSLEMGGVGQITRRGWSQTTFKPGDKVTVMFHPLRDGSNGGQFVTVTQLNGKPFSG